MVSLAIYQPYKSICQAIMEMIPIQIFAINRSDVSVDEALAEQYQITLDELWDNILVRRVILRVYFHS